MVRAIAASLQHIVKRPFRFAYPFSFLRTIMSVSTPSNKRIDGTALAAYVTLSDSAARSVRLWQTVSALLSKRNLDSSLRFALFRWGSRVLRLHTFA